VFTTDTAHKAFTYKLHRPQQTADICRQWGVCHLHTPPLPTPLREQFATGTKLPLQFAFSTHPHVFNVLGVDVAVIRIHEMCLVHDDRVRINAAVDRLDVGVCRPAV